MLNIEYFKLKDIVAELFIKAGVPRESAEMEADALTLTEAKGVASHGIGLLLRYIQFIENEHFNRAPNIRIVRQTATSTVIDGDCGLGAVVMSKAMEIAMEKAAKYGSATANIVHSNHYGAGLYYVGLAAENNMVAHLYGNSNAELPPYGGTKRLLGTNPYTFGAPAGKYAPYIFDAATTVVARNKLNVIASQNQSVPDGWGVDGRGRPTNDPNVILNEGWILHFGGIKGYALSAMISILGGVLTPGAGYDESVVSLPHNAKERPDFGAFVQVTDINSLMSLDEYNTRIERFIRCLKTNPPVEGVKEVTYPGEIEARRLERSKSEGVELLEIAEASLRSSAEYLGENLDEMLK